MVTGNDAVEHRNRRISRFTSTETGERGVDMADLDGSRIRQAAVPAVASLAGAGLGLLLTRGSKLSEALPRRSDLPGGDLADELMEKLDALRGKRQSSGGSLDAGELDRRLRKREERRKQRHARR
jgi:hypothetical protein